MVRHEGDANPEGLRILRVRTNSMEPEMREGDRLVVDTARRVPAAGELFVLWDADGLVVKRVEPAHAPGAPKLRLFSANPTYPPYTCLGANVHIVGKVLWKVTRVWGSTRAFETSRTCDSAWGCRRYASSKRRVVMRRASRASSTSCCRSPP